METHRIEMWAFCRYTDHMLDDEFVNSLRKACLTCIRRHDECTLLDIATEIRDSVCQPGVADAHVPYSDHRRHIFYILHGEVKQAWRCAATELHHVRVGRM